MFKIKKKWFLQELFCFSTKGEKPLSQNKEIHRKIVENRISIWLRWAQSGGRPPAELLSQLKSATREGQTVFVWSPSDISSKRQIIFVHLTYLYLYFQQRKPVFVYLPSHIFPTKDKLYLFGAPVIFFHFSWVTYSLQRTNCICLQPKLYFEQRTHKNCSFHLVAYFQ